MKLGLFVVVFLLCVARFSLTVDNAGLGAGFEVASVAKAIAAGRGFSDPYEVPTGPTAHVAPAYTYLVGATIALLGSHTGSVIALALLNAAAVAFAAALLPMMSWRIWGTEAPGFVAGLLIVACARMAPQYETAFAFLACVATCILVANGAGPLKTGFAWGCGLLVNPVLLLPIGTFAGSRGRRFVLTAGVCALAVCLPWIVRNWIVLGEPSFVRNNLGLELSISNGPGSRAEMGQNVAGLSRRPVEDSNEARLVRELGEPEYNRIRMGQALRWIGDHPRLFVNLTAARGWRYWFPSTPHNWRAYPFIAVSLLAIPGLWLRRRDRASRWLAASMLAASLPFLVIQTDVRYRFPAVWMDALLAGYALVSAYRWASEKARGRFATERTG